jgi:hypothetical protein
MATSGRGSGVVGYDVQVAVDTEHHLIITHEVTNDGSDRAQLANIASQAKPQQDDRHGQDDRAHGVARDPHEQRGGRGLWLGCGKVRRHRPVPRLIGTIGLCAVDGAGEGERGLGVLTLLAFEGDQISDANSKIIAIPIASTASGTSPIPPQTSKSAISQFVASDSRWSPPPYPSGHLASRVSLQKKPSLTFRHDPPPLLGGEIGAQRPGCRP